MKKILQLILLFLLIGNMGFAQTPIIQESFEGDKTNYDANFFDGGTSDYFGVHVNGTAPEDGWPVVTINNIDGQDFIVAEDVDNVGDNPLGAGEHAYIVISSQNISSYDQVQVEVSLISVPTSGFEAAETDGFYIQYAFDGNIATAGDLNVNTGTYTTIGAFRGNGTFQLQEDTDLSGSADVDGTVLTNTFQDFTYTFSTGGATNVSIRVKIDVDGYEEVGLDNIRISGIVAASAPTVTTQAVSSITQTTATGNGNITDLGSPNPTQHGVCWNTGGTPTIADNKTEDGAVSATGAFTSSITSLSPNTTYYVRAYATNTEGTSYGSQVSFTTDPEPATVTTQAVTAITKTTATGNGNVTSLGDPNPTQHGVCWNTGGTPTIADSKTEDGAVSATGAFTSSITSLSANTTYYVRAYVTNTAGTTYGSQVSFTTDPQEPTITTQAVTSITQSTATGNGNITDLGDPNPTQHGVCWNTGGTPTTADSKTEEGATAATGAFTSSITSLSPNTTYYVRAYATNTAGTVYGNQVSFTTDPEPATVTTQAVTAITKTTATGNGNVTDLGDPNPTQHGVCWNTGGTPTIANSKTEDGAVSATGTFTSSITSLSANTTYYVRAYVTNTAGTTYGSQVSFTTDPQEPTVTTQAVTSITQTTATGNGNITALGDPNPTQHGVCWNTGGNPTTADSKTEEGATAATGAFTSSITSLSPNTTYYVRAYATNTAGTVYGNQVSFTTDPEPATVTTQAVTAITKTTATGNGNVTDLGDPNTTQHGVCWNTGGIPTIANSKTEDGAVSATGAFTSSITSLNANTTYYVRAYVTNTAGTTYGSQVSFTTDPQEPTITTQAVTSITQTTATGNGNITDLGTPNPTQYGVCWNMGGTPTTSDNKTTEGVASANGAFTSSITSLSPNTTYYVRAYATNTAGTVYGNQVSFTTDPEPATVTTQVVTDIEMTTATGNGNVTDLGDPNPTQHGVCWNTGGTPTLVDSKTEDGTVSATGAFTSSITSLSANTTYYVRAYVTNTAGTSYGTEVSFTTDPQEPTVTTQAATDITTTSFRGNGNITDLGTPNPTAHGFCYNTTGSPTLSDDWVTQGAVSATGAFSSTINFLDPNTTYYVRAYATNTAGTVYGAEISLATLPEPATVTTQAVTDITITTATGNGNITYLGDPNPTQHGVCWNTGGTPTLADSKTEDGVVSATGAFTSSITSLSANTTYYVRAYVTNTAGTTYGSEMTFTTLAAPPSVTTNEISEFTTTSAILLGTVNAMNSSTVVRFEYGLTDAYGTAVTADESPVTGTSDTQVSYELTGLTPNTTYHYRLVGVNDGGTSNGADMTFVTTPEPPVVTTQDVSGITQTTATGNGNITNLGNPNVSQHGVCWSTSENPTISDNKTEEGVASVTGAFTSDITGLSAYTTYYVKAYAINSAGTVYGTQISFTTLPLSATVTTQAVTEIGITTATGNGQVTNLGVPNPIQHGVCWNTTGTPTITDSKTEDGGVSVTGAYTSSITGLIANTTYYVRAYVTNEAGTSYGSEVTFTSIELAEITTQDVSGITQTTATGNGNITNLGNPNVSQHGVCWSTSENPTISDNKTEEGVASTIGAFTSNITGLNPYIMYYVRSYATNEAGTVYGEQVSFRTIANAPAVISQEVKGLEAKVAILSAVVNANEAETAVSFEYGLTDTYGENVIADQSPITGSSNQEVSKTITGLSPNETYHFRVATVNEGGTSYGDDVSFTTNKLTQIITFDALPDKQTGDADFDPEATSSLGLDISYESTNEQVATISNNMVHIVGAGTTSIIAYQLGNDTVYLATPVEQSLTVTQATGIGNTYLANIKVYPNPVSELLCIDIGDLALKDYVNISIVDLNGKIVFCEKTKDSISKIDVSDFSSGLYFVEISASEGIKKLKIIIE